MNNENEVEIVLVEDNSQDGELTLRALRKHNLANRVRWLRDGAEALEYLMPMQLPKVDTPRLVPKVILLDIKLPKVDGLEVLRQLKTNKRTHTIPIVMLTSSAEERDVIDSYQHGVNSYIVKPVEFTKFSAAVAELGLYWLVLNHPPGFHS